MISGFCYLEEDLVVEVVDGPRTFLQTGVDGVDDHVVGGDMALQLEEVDLKMCKSFLKYFKRGRVPIVFGLSNVLLLRGWCQEEDDLSAWGIPLHKSFYGITIFNEIPKVKVVCNFSFGLAFVIYNTLIEVDSYLMSFKFMLRRSKLYYTSK